jgi:hypothetical protein
MFNPGIIFELQNKWKRFTENHPKFPMFVRAVSTMEITQGTIIDVKFTSAEGKTISTNVKLTQDDVDSFREIAEMMKKMQ